MINIVCQRCSVLELTCRSLTIDDRHAEVRAQRGVMNRNRRIS